MNMDKAFVVAAILFWVAWLIAYLAGEAPEVRANLLFASLAASCLDRVTHSSWWKTR